MQEATFTHEELLLLAFLLRQHRQRAGQPTPNLEEIDRKLSALVNDNDAEAPDFKVGVMKQ